MVKLLDGIKFTKLQKQEINKTPFSELLLAITEEDLDEAFAKKSDIDALQLVRQYEPWGSRFKLGDQSVKIT